MAGRQKSSMTIGILLRSLSFKEYISTFPESTNTSEGYLSYNPFERRCHQEKDRRFDDASEYSGVYV